MKKEYFEGFDFDSFWDNCEYALEEYEGEPATDEMIAAAEEALGYKLPQSYVHFVKHQNGGIPTRQEFLTKEPSSYAQDHIAISGIFGVDEDKFYSIYMTEFMIEEWEYPDIGIAICDCPSAGHEMIFLDYRKCGKNGEPCVVYIDQEDDYSIIKLANNFEEFIRGLIKYDYKD